MSSSADKHELPSGIRAALASLVWRITPACREVARLTSEEREHRLPLITRLRLSLHRSFCVLCDRYARQLELIHEAMQELPGQPESADTLAADRKAQLKRALREEASRD